MSAIEYARAHPDETVYFVSEDNDFKKASYPSPMREDLDGLEKRFVHLTNLKEVADQFTESTTPDEDLVRHILQSSGALSAVARASRELRPTYGAFLCTAARDLDDEPVTVATNFWKATSAIFDALESVETYRVGDHEWGIAVVRWSLTGVVNLDLDSLQTMGGACSWTASVLFRMDAEDPRLTVLRHQQPSPVGRETFKTLELTNSIWTTELEKALLNFAASLGPLREQMLESGTAAVEAARRLL
ncbi:hypothetical protein ACR6C2_07845 [Streptomyces sp. INA 01156]